VAGRGKGLRDGDEAHLVVMGRIVGAFGVQGWVKVKTFTGEPDALGGFPRWRIRTREGWREVAVEEFEVHSKGPVAKLEGCGGREAAAALRGSDIAERRETLGEAGEGRLSWVEVVGLEVVDEQGTVLGTVDGLFETGETSVLVVKGGKERMIPFVPAYVKGVDREAQRITVDWKADYDA
jgi:16S rRNA processing protein RimM